MMRSPAALCWLLGFGALAGCSRQPTVDCEPTERYSTARSVSPVQIPDDLSPPDESDALRLPPATGVAAENSRAGCLEAPPAFSRGTRPERAPTTPDQAPASDAQQVEPEDPNRVIEN
jgi:hypothetical protein